MCGNLTGMYTSGDGNDELIAADEAADLLEHSWQNLRFDCQDNGLHFLDCISCLLKAVDRPALFQVLPGLGIGVSDVYAVDMVV